LIIYIDENAEDGTEDNPLDENEDTKQEQVNDEIEEGVNEDEVAEQEDGERPTARYDFLNSLCR
jgi:hypothetical protein